MLEKLLRLTRLRARRVQETWEHLGRTDPYWAILSDESKRGGAWDPEEFYATGSAEIEALLSEVGALLPGRRRALDFGCGAGRLTFPLAKHFESVDGVDVARSMLDLARLRSEMGGTCRFHLNVEPNLRLFEEGTFDLIYSNITLQHMPPGLARSYIAEFLRILRPGGVAVFQLPVHWDSFGLWTSLLGLYRRGRVLLRRRVPTSLYRVYRSLLGRGQAIPADPVEPEMEMYGLRMSRALKVIESRGGRLLEVRIWGAVGAEGWDSYRYVVQR